MTETVHVRTYTERRDTLTTYDWQRRRALTREHVRWVPSVQVVEFDDTEPGDSAISTNAAGRYQQRKRYDNMRRAKNVLRKHGPMTKQKLSDLVGVASSTLDNLIALDTDLSVIASHGNERIVGLPGQSYTPPVRYTPVALRIADYLHEHGPHTAPQIDDALGVARGSVLKLLKRYRDDLFRVAHVGQTKYKRERLFWDVIREQEQ